MPVYCGIDVGTQGVRVVLIDETGAERAFGTAPVPAGRHDGPRHEQSPQSWWTALTTALRTALSTVDAHDIVALALDATSGTVLVQDQQGTALGPALMYDDARATAQAARAQSAGAELWSALGYRMQPAWALPKALWLRENGATDHIVHQSDHLLGRLAGYPVPTDTSHALKMGADLRTGTWPESVYAALGLPVAVLPDLVAPGTRIGRVGVTAARETGLAAGTPIVAGMTDGCAAQIAARALRPGDWSSALGTTLVVKGATRELVRDPTGAVYSHRHPDGGWLPGGASSSGAGALRVDGGFDALTAAAAGLVPMPGVTYPLVGRGERFPFVAPDAAGFLAVEARTPAARFAALCQGIAYVERLAYDVLGMLGADITGAVTLSGGTARNAWWNQLRTDVLGRPTLVPASTQAATGMAVLAAAPPGELTATAERMVRITHRYEPDPERGAALRPGYERLVDALVARSWLPVDVADRAVGR